MKKYKVYLFRSPDCVRGWLAYLKPGVDKNRATVAVIIEAPNGSKAKNKAITKANIDLQNMEIFHQNFNDEIWGINNFADLLIQLPRRP